MGPTSHPYQYRVVYKPGKNNPADYLSRHTPTETPTEHDHMTVVWTVDWNTTFSAAKFAVMLYRTAVQCKSQRSKFTQWFITRAEKHDYRRNTSRELRRCDTAEAAANYQCRSLGWQSRWRRESIQARFQRTFIILSAKQISMINYLLLVSHITWNSFSNLAGVA